MLPTPEITDIDYDKVYEPAEDSFLLLDCFEEEKEYLQKRFTSSVPIVTEIGAGSGIVTTFLQRNILQKSIFMCTDVNPHACTTILNTVKTNNVKTGEEKIPYIVDSFQMDRTTAIRSQSIDVLVFNPPYVPAEDVPKIPTTYDDSTWLDLALLGGEDGMVTTWKVLDNLDQILSTNKGVAYILFCARNKPDSVADKMKSRGWDVKTIIHRKAGWEVLSVLRFTRI
ncbi:uncharacterized protein RJT20DRAFT_98137 [Scheffersomyces xylosifermentans]|uniref:uncharacterized protein n=1 Tax=Scheffersomyces xylosifermentans TaxID=1304137 RepID=UPI00315D8974